MMHPSYRIMLAMACLVASGAMPAIAQTPRTVSFEEAVVSALERHPSVAAAAKAVDAAQARLVQARAGSAVQVSASARASVGTLSPSGIPTGADPAASHNVSVDASFPLFDGGIRGTQIAQAEAALASAQASLLVTRQDIALAAAQSYFQVLRAIRVVEVREASLLNARRQVEQAEALVRAGTAPRADVVRAQAVAASADADLIAARSNVELAVASLRNAMGIPITEPIAVREPPVIPAVEIAPADAAAEAERVRPEMRRSAADIQGAEFAQRLAELSAGVSVSVAAASSALVTPSPGQFGWSVGATVTYPILDGGRAKAAVDEAKANVDAARAKAETTRQQVQLQAFQAALNQQQTRARLQAVRASAAAADESLRVAEGRYRAGVTILLEVLDAQVAATEARVTLGQTEYDLLLAAVALRHALGRPVFPP